MAEGSSSMQPEFSIEHGAVRERDTSPKPPANEQAALERGEPAGNARQDSFPEHVRRKYYVVGPTVEHESSETRVYADSRGEYLAFKDTGERLSTRLDSPEVVRDMIAVAQHRGWASLHVRGSSEFRREAWVRAQARGLEVTGYEPTELDHAAVAKHRDVQDQTTRGRARTDVANPEASRGRPDEASRTDRVDYDQGVAGRLVDVGSAPYQNRKDAETSGYVDLTMDDGRQHRIWGSGLEKAVQESRAEVGDWIRVRREGVDVVAKDLKVTDAKTGQTMTERRSLRRNRWSVTAEKFRSLNRTEAVKDPDLVAAHSHLAVIERALQQAFPNNTQAREFVLRTAQDRIAEHLDSGHTFRRAQIRAIDRAHGQDEPTSERIRDQPAHERGHARER
jgi:hypothetical protein